MSAPTTPSKGESKYVPIANPTDARAKAAASQKATDQMGPDPRVPDRPAASRRIATADVPCPAIGTSGAATRCFDWPRMPHAGRLATYPALALSRFASSHPPPSARKSETRLSDSCASAAESWPSTSDKRRSASSTIWKPSRPAS